MADKKTSANQSLPRTLTKVLIPLSQRVTWHTARVGDPVVTPAKKSASAKPWPELVSGTIKSFTKKIVKIRTADGRTVRRHWDEIAFCRQPIPQITAKALATRREEGADERFKHRT